MSASTIAIRNCTTGTEAAWIRAILSWNLRMRSLTFAKRSHS
jgi:hypothetical protein